MPEAQDMLGFFKQAYAFWREYTGLPIDEEDFIARYLRAWARGSLEHITLDEITLAAIIEASARRSLTPRQLASLRAEIRVANERLIARAKAARAEVEAATRDE